MDKGGASQARGLNIDGDGFLTSEAYLQEFQAGAIRESVKEILSGFDADAAELPGTGKECIFWRLGPPTPVVYGERWRTGMAVQLG